MTKNILIDIEKKPGDVKKLRAKVRIRVRGSNTNNCSSN